MPSQPSRRAIRQEVAQPPAGRTDEGPDRRPVPDSVDQRLLAALGAMERLFYAYARCSDVAETHAEALDVSERSLAKRMVEEEQRRLAGIAT